MIKIEAVEDTYVVDQAHPTLSIWTSLNTHLSFLEFFEVLHFIHTHLGGFLRFLLVGRTRGARAILFRVLLRLRFRVLAATGTGLTPMHDLIICLLLLPLTFALFLHFLDLFLEGSLVL